MTRSLNPVAVSLVLDAVESLQTFLPARDLAQEPLDLTGEVQAIDAFMAEREEHKETVRRLRCEVGALQENLSDQIDRNAALVRNDELMTEVLLQAAQHVQSLKTKLAAIGITFAPSATDGEVVISVVPEQLLGALDRALAA